MTPETATPLGLSPPPGSWDEALPAQPRGTHPVPSPALEASDTEMTNTPSYPWRDSQAHQGVINNDAKKHENNKKQ